MRLRATPFFVAFLFSCAPACGGGARPAATPAPRASVSPPAAATPVLPRTIDVATSGVFHPFSDWEVDRPGGFAPTLMESFAKASDVEIRWSRFRWSELREDLKGGRFAVISDGVKVRPYRTILGRLSVPIARGAAVLLLRRPAWAAQQEQASTEPRDVVRALDKPELRVVMPGGGHLERVTRSLFRAASIRALSWDEELRQALTTGEADALMTDTFKALEMSKGLEDLERIGPIGSQAMSFWVRADEPLLAERLDQWLIEEEESGRLRSLRASLLGPGGGTDSARPLEAILSATIERLSLMPYVAAAKKREGKPASDPAGDSRKVAAAAAAVAKAAARWKTPPPRPLVEAFFRAELDASTMLETSAPEPPAGSPSYSYERELRPALDRIDEKLAFVLAKLPSTPTRHDVGTQTHEDLAETGLDDHAIGRLSSAIEGLARR